MMSGDSITVVHPLFREEGDGSIPISPLQLEVAEIDFRLAIKLNAHWHSILPKITQTSLTTKCVCYAAFFKNVYYAVAIWSLPVARFRNNDKLLELRRFAIGPEAPANTASRMLSVMRKMIRKKFPEIKTLISYQATHYHDGTIYKASGWRKACEIRHKPWSDPRRKPGRPVGRHREGPQIKSAKIRWETDL